MAMFARVLRGLGRSFRKIGSFLVLLGAISIVSGIVAIPLWYFSSNHAAGYTIFVVALLAAALLYVLISRLVRLGREPQALQSYFVRKFLPILKTVTVVVASVAVVYGIALLVSRGYTVPAIITAILWILLLGFLKYARQGKR
jgi:hypothetical protein